MKRFLVGVLIVGLCLTLSGIASALWIETIPGVLKIAEVTAPVSSASGYVNFYASGDTVRVTDASSNDSALARLQADEIVEGNWTFHGIVTISNMTVTATTIGLSAATVNISATAIQLIGDDWTKDEVADDLDMVGGTVNQSIIGGTTAASATFTTMTVTGQVTSTLPDGTAPFVLASSTKVVNLNVDYLDDHDSIYFGTAADVASLISSMATVEASIATIEADIVTLESSMATVEASIATIEADIVTLESSMATVEASVVTAEADIVALESSMATVDALIAGHIDGVVFHANTFLCPVTATEWKPELVGVGLPASQTGALAWIALDWLKAGDEIVSYAMLGDIQAGGTFDSVLYKVLIADPPSTTAITGGAIATQSGDGNFDVEADLTADETVVTDTMYTIQISGTTGAGNVIVILGAEVTVNRKL